MFSERTGVVTHLNQLAIALAKRRAAGLPVVDLTASNPTQAGFTYRADRILGALSSPRVLAYEPDPFGLRPAREAVASETGFAHPDRILLTASTSEAYSFLFKLLCNPGDDVLVPVPSYPLFAHLAALEHVRLRPYRLLYDGRWHIDLNDLGNAVTPATRAIIVVNPNNPTGSFLKRDEIHALRAMGIPLISDEVFSAYALRDDEERAITARNDDVLTFVLGGLSKQAGLPQMKLAWTLISGPGADDARERLELIADTFLSVGAPVQHALPAFLDEGRALQSQIRARLSANLAVIREVLPSSPISALDVEGGWTVPLRLPRTRSDEDWALQLLDTGVLTQPGYFYDFHLDGILVISLLCPSEMFRAGLEIIRATVVEG